MKNALHHAFYLLLALAVLAIVILLTFMIPGDRPASNPDYSANRNVFPGAYPVLLVLLVGILFIAAWSVGKIRSGSALFSSLREKPRKSEEEMLRIENDYHRMIAEVEDYAIILLDTHGTIRNWNKGAQKIKGYEAGEIIGKNFRQFYTREDIALGLPEKILADARQNGKAVYEGWRVRKNGTSFWGSIVITALHDERGTVIGYTKVTSDITERRKAEEKFYSLLDSAPDATVIVNEEGLIQMANSQTEKLFAYSRFELVGKPVELLIPAELRNRHVQHRADFARSSKVRAMGMGIELNAVKKGGVMFPVEISLSPIHTDEGMLIAASVRDISHRKSLEDELKKTNSELEAFSYSVSHDLRAPLRGIIGFTAVLEEEYSNKLDEEAKRITSIIKNNTMKMGRLIDDLLNFSRTGRQELIRAEINSEAMVREVIDELTGQAGATRIAWNIGTLLPVKGDISTIRQVWMNLISNAIKYSGHRPDAVIEIGSRAEEGSVIFFVKDNGIGFDELYKDKLFKVFQRLHNAEDFDGTGVGLALVEKIITKHRGKVWAKGKTNEGACFFFSLPA